MSSIIQTPTPVYPVALPFLEKWQIRVFIKRDDLTHPLISGNKWRKLKYNMEAWQKNGVQRVLTFGGAYSNHIAAVGAVGNAFSFETIGIIRGEEASNLNATLHKARENGMRLVFVDRKTYRRRQEVEWQSQLQELYGPCKILPEGGTNSLALQGCAELGTEILEELPFVPDHICISAGTGGTAAGLIKGLNGRSHVLVFSALRGNFLKTDIGHLLEKEGCFYQNWRLISDYFEGGFGKLLPETLYFIKDFYQTTGIPLDPLYTGKMMQGIFQMIQEKKFLPGTTLLVIHSGGLQGWAGMQERFGKGYHYAGASNTTGDPFFQKDRLS